jgi:hypothetical protein
MMSSRRDLGCSRDRDSVVLLVSAQVSIAAPALPDLPPSEEMKAFPFGRTPRQLKPCSALLETSSHGLRRCGWSDILFAGPDLRFGSIA